jgi:hypothetical protein
VIALSASVLLVWINIFQFDDLRPIAGTANPVVKSSFTSSAIFFDFVLCMIDFS